VWNEETVSWDSIEGEEPRPDVGGE
jgi:hypothetical protein